MPADDRQQDPATDVYPWVIGHRLFPIALLTHDQYWYDQIAEELRVDVNVIANIIDDEGRRA